MRKAIIRRNSKIAAEACWEGQDGGAGTEPGWRAGPAKRDLWLQTWVGRSGRCVRMGGEGSRHEEEQGGGP